MAAISIMARPVFGRIFGLTFMKKQFGQWSLSFGGVACIICWILLFSAGLFVDTKPFRDGLTKGFNLGDLFRVCLCYTPTNAALLTCLAGLAGGISSRLTYSRFVEDPVGIVAPENLTVANVLVRTENPVASMLRSFIVYFIFVAGLVLASPQNPFSEATQDQYFRFAAMVSVLGFVVGYDPSVFNSLIRKLPWIREQQQEPATVKVDGTPATRP
jgi:hypothetical protein